ncbi:MAG: glycosyltransferase, partial [Bdellovibrionota bacterium]
PTPAAATLIVSTYNMPRHLGLVLEGVALQSIRDFELVICDDGSGSDTRDLIDRFRPRFGAKTGQALTHVWQENRGFRKCRILNEGLRRSSGAHCIFLDGDCVPHRDYVADHLREREPGRYLAGRRVELGPTFSEDLTSEDVARGSLGFPPSYRLFVSALTGDSDHLQRLVRFPAPWMRRLVGMNRIDDLKGCNYSVAREALLALNGFDEEYEGYGREDTDIEIRLQNLGLTIKSMKGVALQYHVWHPRREFTDANDARLEETRKIRRIRCEKGISER